VPSRFPADAVLPSVCTSKTWEREPLRFEKAILSPLRKDWGGVCRSVVGELPIAAAVGLDHEQVLVGAPPATDTARPLAVGERRRRDSRHLSVAHRREPARIERHPEQPRSRGRAAQPVSSLARKVSFPHTATVIGSGSSTRPVRIDGDAPDILDRPVTGEIKSPAVAGPAR
jgi:hypothetical protein